MLPARIGSINYRFRLTESTPKEPVKVNIISFTKVGLELRKVIHSSSNPVYNAKFEEWIVNKFKVTIG